MRGTVLRVCPLVLLLFLEVSGFKVRNKLLGKCLQAQDGASGGRVSLGECQPSSPSQEWHWLPGSQALSSLLTGECLTAPAEQYEGVHLQPCVYWLESEEPGDDSAAVEVGRGASSQEWSCSKKGHLTLMGRGLHLTATQESTLVFLSREHKQGSRWRTLDNHTVCNGREHGDQPPHHLSKSLETVNAHSDTDRQAQSGEGMMSVEVTEANADINVSSVSSKPPVDPTMVFFSMDYGMAWKITMLVLSSLALVLGTVILILSVYSNRRRKVVCVLKSYTPRPDAGVPGSPVPSERAPLTEHAMRLPHSTPTLQRGEILIEWKDGTVTPLYEA